jgi:acyl-CoA thioesterase FadM
MDFHGYAHFDDEYIIHTKISSLKGSSFVMEQAITLPDGTLLVYATSTEQHINPATKAHQTLPSSFCKLVTTAEGDNLQGNSSE